MSANRVLQLHMKSEPHELNELLNDIQTPHKIFREALILDASLKLTKPQLIHILQKKGLITAELKGVHMVYDDIKPNLYIITEFQSKPNTINWQNIIPLEPKDFTSQHSKKMLQKYGTTEIYKTNIIKLTENHVYLHIECTEQQPTKLIDALIQKYPAITFSMNITNTDHDFCYTQTITDGQLDKPERLSDGASEKEIREWLLKHQFEDYNLRCPMCVCPIKSDEANHPTGVPRGKLSNMPDAIIQKHDSYFECVNCRSILEPMPVSHKSNTVNPLKLIKR